MDVPNWKQEGILMAHDEEPLLAHPPTHEVANHVADYERFTKMLKWSAMTCLILGLLSLVAIKSYW
jgi:hypothetical protein